MLKRAVLVLLILTSPAAAQDTRTQCRWVGTNWTCDTKRSGIDFSKGLQDGQNLVPNYADQEEQKARTRLLEEQAEALRQQNLRASQQQATPQSAPPTTALTEADVRRVSGYGPRCLADSSAIEAGGDTLKQRIAEGMFMGADLIPAFQRDHRIFCLGYQHSNFDALSQGGVRNPRPGWSAHPPEQR